MALDAISGGIYGGLARRPPDPDNAFWALLTHFDPVSGRYSWSEQYPSRGGQDATSKDRYGPIPLPSGRRGYYQQDPAVVRDSGKGGPALSYVRIQRAYFDADLGWVHYILDSVLTHTVQDTRYCVNLSAAVNATDFIIHVTSCALMNPDAPPFLIRVENELMELSLGCPSLAWTVTRGVSGTKAVAHPNSAPVCLVRPGVRTVLTAAMGIADTTLTVTSQEWFPSDARYYIQIDDEIMLVVDGWGTTTWTVERAQEGTVATTHPVISGDPLPKVYWRLPDTVKQVHRILFDDWALVEPATPDPDDGGHAVRHREATQVVFNNSSDKIPGSIYYDGVIQYRDLPGSIWVTAVSAYLLDLNS